MNFEKAVKAPTIAQRNELIIAEINDEGWSLENHMTHGGWPDNEAIETIVIEDETDEEIVVRIEITGLERVSGSCPDITHDYHISGTFRLRIEKELGDFDSECTDFESKSEYEDDDDDIRPMDYV